MPIQVAAVCRNCRVKSANRPMGLCWGCYYTPGVRVRFSSTSKFAKRGVLDSYAKRPLPAEATDRLAGTEGKIAVLEERAAMGVGLWHPGDARADER